MSLAVQLQAQQNFFIGKAIVKGREKQNNEMEQEKLKKRTWLEGGNIKAKGLRPCHVTAKS